MIAAVAATLASCSSTNRTMKEPNMRVEFQKEDFTISAQVSGEATENKIIGIDWARLFNKQTGTVASQGGLPIPSLASIPVIGGVITSQAQAYALYDLMQKNPGYDVVMYPSFETKSRWFIIGRTTTVKVNARLAKLK